MVSGKRSLRRFSPRHKISEFSHSKATFKTQWPNLEGQLCGRNEGLAQKGENDFIFTCCSDGHLEGVSLRRRGSRRSRRRDRSRNLTIVGTGSTLERLNRRHWNEKKVMESKSSLKINKWPILNMYSIIYITLQSVPFTVSLNYINQPRLKRTAFAC